MSEEPGKSRWKNLKTAPGSAARPAETPPATSAHPRRLGAPASRRLRPAGLLRGAERSPGGHAGNTDKWQALDVGLMHLDSVRMRLCP